MKSKEEVLKKINQKILVSCQSPDNSPLRYPEEIAKLAETSVLGGSIGVRINYPENVKAVRERLGEDVIILGIYKIRSEGCDVYITPTLKAVDDLVAAGADIIALDATDRKNVYGNYVRDMIPTIKEKYPELVIMADCAKFEDAKIAAKLGADIVGSTLAGYTKDTEHLLDQGAAFDLIREMRELEDVLVLAEGRLWSREDVVKAFDSGADLCVIGTAITNPIAITERFVKAAQNYFEKREERI